MKKLFNKSNWFIFLMTLSTLALAGSAAYYSVFGLSSLFAGARTEVIIMAGALEFSKLIIASYLHNHWSRAGWMKWYLTIAVGVLMVITSAGIYGFLTSAYQKTADQLGVLDKQVQVIELKKGRFQDQLDYYNEEKTQISESINGLRNGLSNNVIQYKDKETGEIITTTSSSQRRVLERQLDNAVTSRTNVSKKIEVFTDSVTSLDLKILDLESNNEVAAEVGPLRYMSEITGKPMNVIVNWFTLLIVFVFDPLALSMVIALNKLTIKPKEDDITTPDMDTNTLNDDSDYSYEDNQFETDLDDINDWDVTLNDGLDDDEALVVKEEKKEVKFIPTDKEYVDLYGDKPSTPKVVKHIYKNT